MKIVGAIFEKIKIFYFFLMWNTLNLGVGGKLKTARDIYNRTLDIEFEWDQSIRLGSTIGNGQTDTHIHIFLKHILDSGSDVESKIITKSKSNFLTIAIPVLPSLLMLLESKRHKETKVNFLTIAILPSFLMSL